jgi:hypothetical protein
MLSEGDLPLTPIDLDADKHLRPGSVGRAKLETLVWVVQEKLVVHLFWKFGPIESFIMPLESRNSMKLEAGIAPPDEWDGQLWMQTENWAPPGKTFFIVLGFDI